ncbi:hypothetical protein AB0I91_19095 [Actinosynnema sp. NPDC049800]
MNLRDPRPAEGRRLLVATAVTRHRHHHLWDRPTLTAARRDVIDLFTTRLGYRHLPDLGVDPTRDELAAGLRDMCSPRAPDPLDERDMLAVYITCHGHVLEETGEHVLITSDTHPDDLGDALSTSDLTAKLLRGTRVRRLLLMLDTCHSGRGGNEIAARALSLLTDTWGREPGAGMVVVASSQPNEEAVVGMFPRLLRDAVDAAAVAGHGPTTLDPQVLVEQMNKNVNRPGHQRIGIAKVGMTGAEPPFLLNPRHDNGLDGVDLASQKAAEWRATADKQEIAFRNDVLRRAMGSHDAPEGGWWFTGRRDALRDLSDWLNRPDASEPLRVVTGAPGSGKSAVLGILAALSDPDRRPSVPVEKLDLPDELLPSRGAVDVRLTARGLTTGQVLHAVASAARVDASTAEELLRALAGRTLPFTVLLDGLDEAAAPLDLAGGLLASLVESAQGRIRFLVGTRPHLLPVLVTDLSRADERLVTDLDAPRYADRPALTAYAIRNLLGATVDSAYGELPRRRLVEVAEAVAEAAGTSFLVARITATTLSAEPPVTDPGDRVWRASLPSVPGDAMRRDLEARLGDDVVRARDLLIPLAHAEGQGLQWEDVWAPLATRISGRGYTDEDIVWLRRNAGSYIVENTDHGRSAYRLYHQALAEHLREDTDAHRVHDAFTTVLRERVPLSPEARMDWARASPYARAHLATHAAAAGRMDELVLDAEYLVHADPDTLLPVLHHAITPTATTVRAVYRTTPHRSLTPAQRRLVLSIDALRFGDSTLSRTFGRAHPWRPRWATGHQTSTHLRATLTGHTGSVRAVACFDMDGRSHAVTAGNDRTIRVWDLADGVLRSVAPHPTRPVHAIACIAVDGRPHAVVGGNDKDIAVWDLADNALRVTLTSYRKPVLAVACTTIDGLPHALTATGGMHIQIWNLTDGSLRATINDPALLARSLAVLTLDGRPHVVTTGRGNSVQLWRLTDGELVSYAEVGGPSPVRTVTSTVVAGRPHVVLCTADHTVHSWDLTSTDVERESGVQSSSLVKSASSLVINQQPHLITSGSDHTVSVWNSRTSLSHLRATLTGHTGTVRAVDCTTIDGHPHVVTAGDDATARLWNLPLPGTPSSSRSPATARSDVTASAPVSVDGQDMLVVCRRDGTFELRHLADGTTRPWPSGHTGPAGQVRALAVTSVNGQPHAIVTSGDAKATAWDLTNGRWRLTLSGQAAPLRALACTTLDGHPHVLTGGDDKKIRVWDLTNRMCRAVLAGHTKPVRAIACTTIDGRPHAVTGSDDRTVRVWDLHGDSQGKVLGQLPGPVRAVSCTLVHGRPHVLAAGADRTIHVWNLADQTLWATLAGHTKAVRAIACTVIDGTPHAISAGNDNAVRVWNLHNHTGEVLLHQNGLRDVQVGPAGEVVISTGWDLVVLDAALRESGG